jgi:putative transposase
LLDRAIYLFGKPQTIRCDNGPEESSRHLLAWAIERKIDVVHTQPYKASTENSSVESFHRRLCGKCLNPSWFWNLFDARRKIATGP